MSKLTTHLKVRAKQSADRWEMFLRNGRWGTCVDCPTAGDGRAIPELCDNTERDDHQLTPRALFAQYLDFKEAIAEEESEAAAKSEVSIDWQYFDDTATLHNAGVANASVPQVTRLQQAMAAAYKPEEKW